MDWQKTGWFFDNPAEDDWGCRWKKTEVANMGQVNFHPLADWSKLRTLSSPNLRDPFYFEHLTETLDKADDRYVVVIESICFCKGLQQFHELSSGKKPVICHMEKLLAA